MDNCMGLPNREWDRAFEPRKESKPPALTVAVASNDEACEHGKLKWHCQACFEWFNMVR